MTKELKVGGYNVLYRVEWWDGTGHVTFLEVSKHGQVLDLPMSKELPLVTYVYRKEGII